MNLFLIQLFDQMIWAAIHLSFIALYSYCKKTALSHSYFSDMAYRQQFDDMSV